MKEFSLASLQLGRLEKVELRHAWESEAGHFTPWLAQADNLTLLGEAIGIDLQLEAQEKEVGPFRADLLCKDASNDQWVLIENQLERTDHTHLGQLLTYAAGLNAVTIVWVARNFCEEHRATLDWLNEKTADGINFFGLEVELWRIGDSPVAPKFNIISKPNDWSRTVRDSTSTELTEDKQLQLSFWIAYKAYVEATSNIRCSKPYPKNWMNHSIGRVGAHIDSIASMFNSKSNSYSIPELRVELVLDGKAAKYAFAELEKRKDEIQQQLNVTLTWDNPQSAKYCRLYIQVDANIRDKSLWPDQHKWLLNNVEAFRRVFPQFLPDIQSPPV
jgi:hypothetical protein